VNAPFFDDRAVRVMIRNVSITATSPIEARRMADGMSEALERAFARLRATPHQEELGHQRPIDDVAGQISKAVAEHVSRKR